MTEMFAGQNFSQGIKTIFYPLLRHVRMCIIMNKMIKENGLPHQRAALVRNDGLRNKKELKDAYKVSGGDAVHPPSDRRMQ